MCMKEEVEAAGEGEVNPGARPHVGVSSGVGGRCAICRADWGAIWGTTWNARVAAG